MLANRFSAKFLIKNILSIFLLFVTNFIECHLVSIVYNLRMTEANKPLFYDISKHRFNSLSPFNQKVDFNAVSYGFNGLRESFTYYKSKWFFSFNLALGHYNEKFCYERNYGDFTFLGSSELVADDILFGAGYRHMIHNALPINFSGLFGIPLGRRGPLGVGHFGLGAQIDGSYEGAQGFIIKFAARHIIFIPSWRYIFNVTDLLIALNKVFYDKHILEIGYNPTFEPQEELDWFYEGPSRKRGVMSSSFYTSYKYNFLNKKNNYHSLGAALSYGLDHSSSRSANKRTIVFWLNWGINY